MNTSYAFEAIGTRWTIDCKDELDEKRFERLKEAIHDRIDFYDRTYSRFKSDSLLSRAGSTPGLYAFPPDSIELFGTYRDFYEITEGKVTPLIGDVLDSAGYDAEYTLRQKRELTQPYSWDEAFSYESSVLTTYKPIIVDIGAGGKGHLIDIVGELMEEWGVTSYTIDAGGDIRHRSGDNSSLRVGLEDPHDVESVIGIVEIQNMSICGSAGNRRRWGDFHHIIDPYTLTSPRDIEAVWAIAKTTFLADLLTTALFFTPPEVLLRTYEFEYALLSHDGILSYSPNFNGEFFTPRLRNI